MREPANQIDFRSGSRNRVLIRIRIRTRTRILTSSKQLKYRLRHRELTPAFSRIRF